MKKNIYWYIYISYVVIHCLLLTMAILIDMGVLDLVSFGITDYVTDYILRLFGILLLYSILIFIFVRNRFYKDKSKSFVLAILSFTLFFDTIGNFFGWYDVSNIFSLFWFDDLVHFINPILIFIGIYKYLRDIRKKEKSISLLLSSTITFNLVSVWELFEYWVDVIFKTDLVKGGLEDTILDMSFGFLGVVFIYLMLYKLKRV